jgi:hypothetical protein
VAIGWFGEDLWDGVTSAADDVVSGAWDLVDDLPGFKQLGEGTKALFKGPLRDFANTGVGQMVLRAMTTSIMGPIGVVAGPWAMMTAASLPGVARGDSFEEALLSENLWRLEKTAEVLGPDVAGLLPAQYGEAVDAIKARAEELAPGGDLAEAARELAARAGVSPEEYARRLAAELGIREDMAAQAFELVSRLKFLSHDDYDPATGRNVRARLVDAVRGATRSDVAVLGRSSALDYWKPRPSFQIPIVQGVELARPPSFARLLDELRGTPPAPVLDRTARPAEDVPRAGVGELGSPAVIVAAVGVALGAAWWYSSRR